MVCCPRSFNNRGAACAHSANGVLRPSGALLICTCARSANPTPHPTPQPLAGSTSTTHRTLRRKLCEGTAEENCACPWDLEVGGLFSLMMIDEANHLLDLQRNAKLLNLALDQSRVGALYSKSSVFGVGGALVLKNNVCAWCGNLAATNIKQIRCWCCG